MAKSGRSRLAPILLAVFGSLMLLLGLVLNSWLGRLFKPPLWPYALNLSPGVLLIGTAFIINRIVRARLAVIITSCVVSVILFVGTFFLTGEVLWDVSARPETNPSDYKDVLRLCEYPQANWLRHFPADIPENAKNVSFFWHKGFLQSSMFLQLRFVLPGEEIKSLLTQSRGKKAEVPDANKYPHGLPPHQPLRVGETEYRTDWPEQFEIIVFHYGESGHWEKTFNYGLAISVEQNEVVYWTEQPPY